MQIIAEIGQNHNGDINLAKELISSAKENGADVVKFQIYNAKKLFSKKNNPWYKNNVRSELSEEQIIDLNEYCKKTQIEFMASVFDIDLIKITEKIDMRRYKIASRSINDKLLLSKIFKLNKPLIISLGYWKKPYLPFQNKKNQIDYLYCVSKYPAKTKDIKLSKKLFKKVSGFSDHTIGIKSAIKAIKCGAKIIEKHFTMNKKFEGPDHILSMTPNELKELSKYKQYNI